jgi:hypothetical protein
MTSSSSSQKQQQLQQQVDDFDILTIAENPLTLDEAQRRASAISKELGNPDAPVPAAFTVDKAFKEVTMDEFNAIKRDTTPLDFPAAPVAESVRYRLSVQLVGTAHYSRVVVVPSVLKLSQLHDRVLLPLFGVPRRTPPMAYFFAPITPLARFAAPSGGARKVAKSSISPYLRFPVAAGNAALSAGDLTLFGIDALYKADSRSLGQLGLAVGDQLAYVASPLDQGLFFVIRVVALVKSATPDTTVTLESGSGGCLFAIPTTRANSMDESNNVTSLFQRHTDGHFPAVAVTRTIVAALVAKTDLPSLGGGSDTLLGSFLESDEVVEQGLLQPFNLAFWRRHLNLHMMLSYPIEVDETFLNKQPPAKVTRMPNFPRPFVCERCDIAIPTTSSACMCGDCGLLWYCGVECQRQHRGLHSFFCCRLMEMGAAELGRNFDLSEKVVGYSIQHSAHWAQQGSSAPRLIVAPLTPALNSTEAVIRATVGHLAASIATALASSAPNNSTRGGKGKKGKKK